MKPIKKLLIVLLALTVVFTFGQSALAEFGSACNQNSPCGIEVNPNAPGTKYVGPLTISYKEVFDDEEPYNLEGYILTFFLRLRKGSDLYAFSGTAGTPLNPLPGEVAPMQAAIELFIKENVIPRIYECTAYSNCPSAQLKFVDLGVDDDTSQCCNGMIYTIVDVTIAVQD